MGSSLLVSKKGLVIVGGSDSTIDVIKSLSMRLLVLIAKNNDKSWFLGITSECSHFTLHDIYTVFFKDLFYWLTELIITFLSYTMKNIWTLNYFWHFLIYLFDIHAKCYNK